MKMGAIIRLVCFIKTENHVNTVQNFTFQSVNYEYNALFSESEISWPEITDMIILPLY
jgi:hypothetical protein